MSFTAKVICASRVDTLDSEGKVLHSDVVFNADYQDERNREWALATPALNLSMRLNGDAAKLVNGGKSYIITFQEIEPNPYGGDSVPGSLEIHRPR